MRSPRFTWSRTSSRINAANTVDTHSAKMTSNSRWLCNYFRPIAMSNTSITTSVFRSPATIRKVFPYS